MSYCRTCRIQKHTQIAECSRRVQVFKKINKRKHILLGLVLEDRYSDQMGLLTSMIADKWEWAVKRAQIRILLISPKVNKVIQ